MGFRNMNSRITSGSVFIAQSGIQHVAVPRRLGISPFRDARDHMP